MTDNDQPRWPAGAPDDEHGHGQGGRFAPIGTPGTGGWLRQIGQRLDRGWANDGAARTDLMAVARRRLVGGLGEPANTYDGDATIVRRYDLPDGRSVIHKIFNELGGEDAYVSDDPDDPEYGEFAEGPTDRDRVQAYAEWATAQVAGAVGAPVPPVVGDPQYPAEVWMGYVDGEQPSSGPGGSWGITMDKMLELVPHGHDDAWRLGLLDLLVSNEDRHNLNWLVVDGKPVGIDHGAASVFSGGAGMPADRGSLFGDGVFAGLYREPGGIALRDNHLHPDDIDAAAARIRGLGEGPDRLEQHEIAYMLEVLERLRPHAKGTRRLIP